jgi:uncharacterized protein
MTESEALLHAAREGDPHAQIALAWRAMRGEGQERNPEEAAGWMRRAALQGLPQAQYQLGIWLCLQGKDEDSIQWLEQAGEQGHAMALLNLGHAYRHGHGVDADPAVAREWFTRSAERGCKLAELALEDLAAEV